MVATIDQCRHDPRVDEIYEWTEQTLEGEEVTTVTGECRCCGAFYRVRRGERRKERSNEDMDT